MSQGPTHFIRKDGRIIPITANGERGEAAIKTMNAAKSNMGKIQKLKTAVAATSGVKPNFLLKYGSSAVAVIEGAASALIPVHTKRGIAANAVVHVAGEVGSAAMTVGAFAGKGHAKERAVAMAKHEALNQALGWGTYGAVLLGTKSGRSNLSNAAKTGAAHAQKILAFAKKALNVV